MLQVIDGVARVTLRKDDASRRILPNGLGQAECAQERRRVERLRIIVDEVQGQRSDTVGMNANVDLGKAWKVSGPDTSRDRHLLCGVRHERARRLIRRFHRRL